METAVAICCVFVLTAVVVWNVSKKIVRFGFFVLYFLIGAGIVAAGSVIVTGGKLLPWQAIVASGLVFAVLVRSIRSKMARLVTVLTVMGVLQVFASLLYSPLADKTAADKKVAKKATKPNATKEHPGKPVKHDR